MIKYPYCHLDVIYATLLQNKQKFYYICGVKQTSVILLLTLILIPIFWNGISLVHFVVEHTHTFCETESEHSHPNPENCLAIFQLTENQSESQLPSNTKIDFQELKQYLTPSLELKSIEYLSFKQINSDTSFLPDDSFPKDVFHPPLFA